MLPYLLKNKNNKLFRIKYLSVAYICRGPCSIYTNIPHLLDELNNSSNLIEKKS